jgi:hypothetical protein
MPVDAEVVDGEPARHRALERDRLDRLEVAGGTQRRAGLPTAVGRISQHLKARLLTSQQPDPGGSVGRGGGGKRALGHQPGLGLGGDVGLVTVAFVGAGLAGMAGLGVDDGDDPILGDPPGDPPRAGALARLDILAGHQRQQRDRLGLLVAQLQAVDSCSTASASFTSPDTSAWLASGRPRDSRACPAGHSHAPPARPGVPVAPADGPGGSPRPAG